MNNASQYYKDSLGVLYYDKFCLTDPCAVLWMTLPIHVVVGYIWNAGPWLVLSPSVFLSKAMVPSNPLHMLSDLKQTN